MSGRTAATRGAPLVSPHSSSKVKTMLTMDGSKGEGGGQILRTALALSAVTGTPFRIEKIRAGRSRPGLMRQHLTAVQAAATICGARLEGAEPGSTALRFEPGHEARGGSYRFAVGTAGSATLVFQTILPALLRAREPSTLVLEGGTHNPAAPPFDFLVRSFLPQLAKMGARVTATLEKRGFYPAGGGRFTVTIDPAPLGPLHLIERGAAGEHSAEAVVAGLASSIAERELASIGRVLSWERKAMRVTALPDAYGPGNVVMIVLESEHVTEVMTGFGERGVSAESVGLRVANEAARYLASDVPVGEHLADQLLLPLALAGGGSLRTLEPSSHTRTQAEVIPLFLPVGIQTSAEPGKDRVRIDVIGSPQPGPGLL